MTPGPVSLEARCDLLRSLHQPGAPLLLPNAWGFKRFLGSLAGSADGGA